MRVLKELGKLVRRVVRLKQILRCRQLNQRLFTGDHPNVALSLNNLANLYEFQGKLGEAESLYQQALAMFQRLFADDHPHMALILNNLGLLYKSQGKLAEAEPLLQQALAMFQRLFTGDHPNVALSLNNLAYLYHAQGKLAKAETLYQKCLQETKVVDEQFPRSHFEDLGYRLYVSGQKASCLLPPASSPTTRLPAAVPT